MVHQGQAWSTTASTALPDSLSGALHERDAVGQRPIEDDRLSCRHRCRYCFRRLFLQASAASPCCWRRSAPRSAAAGSPPVSGEAGRLGEGVSLEEHQEDACPRSAWGRSGREQCGGGCARQGSLRVARPVKKRGRARGARGVRPGAPNRPAAAGGRLHSPVGLAGVGLVPQWLSRCRRRLPNHDLYTPVVARAFSYGATDPARVPRSCPVFTVAGAVRGWRGLFAQRRTGGDSSYGIPGGLGAGLVVVGPVLHSARADRCSASTSCHGQALASWKYRSRPRTGRSSRTPS